jgi:hypothetical protein
LFAETGEQLFCLAGVVASGSQGAALLGFLAPAAMSMQ